MGLLSKEQLIEETKRIRDTLKGTVPDFLNISDEQIEKNVEKKYDVYVASYNFAYKSVDNKQKFMQMKQENNIPQYVDFRGTDVQGLNPEELEEHLKEVNTAEKAKHHFNKIVENVVKADFQEMSDVSLHLEKLPQYLEKNSSLVNQAMTIYGLVSNSKNKNKDLITQNAKIFEGVGASLKHQIAFNAHPFSMLFENYEHTLSEKECQAIYGATMMHQDINPVTKGSHKFTEVDEFIAQDTFNTFLVARKDPEITRIHDYLVEHNIKHVDDLKPEKEGQTLQDAILNNDKLVKKDPKEIQEMNNGFNEFEEASLNQRMEDKEHSVPLTGPEFEKYKQYQDKDISREQVADEYFNYVKGITEDKVKKEAQERENKIAAENKEIVDNALKSRDDYEKIPAVARFFSHFLPNSWTETGRKREEMQNAMKMVEFRNLQEEFNNAYDMAHRKIASTRLTGEYKDDGIMQDVQDTTDFINNSSMLARDTKSTNKQREQTKNLVGTMEINMDDLEPDEEDDEMEVQKPEMNERHSIEISEAKNELNSSTENFNREQGHAEEKVEEKENSYDGFEIVQ